MTKKHKFSLRWKLVLFTTILAVITYSFSALFIYVIYDYVKEFWNISEQWFTIGTLFLGVFWSGVLAFFAAGLITKPLHRLEDVASKVAEGDLRQKVEIPKSDDEIRSLSIAFEAMLNNLTEMVHNIEANFKYTNESVAKMREASSVSAEHSNLIRASTDDISKGAESSAISIQQTAELVEEATSLAQEVQRKAEQSKRKSQNMVESLASSKEFVNQLVRGIQTLASDQEKSLEDVEELIENAHQVESIISMVGEIAEQTNLLALNASIEAARAGEHGQGFAVVAEEIRKLADESARAVQQISNLIMAIQKNVNNVVGKIASNVGFAKEEAKTGATTNEAIEQMSVSVTEVAEEIDMISSLVDRQLKSIQETVKQSQEVAAISEETSAATEEVNAAVHEQASTIELVDSLAREIESQAMKLNEEINKFNV